MPALGRLFYQHAPYRVRLSKGFSMSALIVPIPTGIDLRKAFAIAAGLGCQVHCIRCTGEMRVSHPKMPKPCKVNARRKDCPRQLIVWMRYLAYHS
jgi:hypothetical protein